VTPTPSLSVYVIPNVVKSNLGNSLCMVVNSKYCMSVPLLFTHLKQQEMTNNENATA